MKFLLPLMVLALLLAGCMEGIPTLSPDIMDLISDVNSGTPADAGPQRIALISKDRRVVNLVVEIADDPEERSKGLMHRESLPEGFGMLFIFAKPAVLSFWMKNTQISLDIIYLDGAGNYVSHLTMDPCEHDPCSSYKSKGVAQIALEVNAGFVEKHTIGPGWRLAYEKSQ